MALWGKSNEQEHHPLVVETKTNHSVMANTVNVNDVNRIAAGAKFTGDIATVNDIRIDGSFEGRLFSEARVVVGEKAVVKGDIFATFIDFNGTMLGGNFYVKDTLSLKAGCTVEGDLFFQRFQVELDAKFTGKCQVIGEAEFHKIAAPMESILRKAAQPRPAEKTE
jgi:Integral membrane protein CcmA involved in cell shape determination